MNPTPVLKSAVTITVPVHVPAEEENEIEEVVNDGTEVNISVDSTFVSDEEVTPAPPVTVAPTAAPVTGSPIFDDGLPEQPVQQVSGQAIRFPCTCNNGQCGCCTGSILERVRMKACGNISFVPEDFVFDVRLTLNNSTVVRRRVSGIFHFNFFVVPTFYRLHSNTSILFQPVTLLRFALIPEERHLYEFV